MLTLCIHDISSRLAVASTRAREAARLADEVGVEGFLVLLHDDEIGAFRPAPGFPQTLPGGPLWRDFLKACPAEGRFETALPYPDREAMKPVSAYAETGMLFLFLGGPARFPVGEFAKAPLLAALLKAEAVEMSGRASIQVAREAMLRATTLAKALDRARGEVAKKAGELTDALAKADQLNSDLGDLNENLEQRVQEETRERMQAEEALRQAQKMEAIGQLTGGVAHDFNNLLTVIMGSLDSIRRHIEERPDDLDVSRLRRLQDMAFQGAERAATLTSRLLAFARRKPLAPKAVDANKLAVGLSDLLKRTLGETIALETIACAGLWTALVDPAELESALLNLAINARDAMPDGGRLTIEMANIYLGDDYVSALVEPVPAGQYVMVAVSDTGFGMDPGTVERVFEPFFTTKETGKGTGLGLSQVYGFVRQSGGHVRIYSEPGEGTTVKIYIPRLKTNDVLLASYETASPTIYGGSETILVVEDHDGLREYSTGVLKELGYEVLDASDGQEALTTLRARRDINLLFTDVVLPGLNGRQLADEAMRLRPDLRILFTTGYTRNAIVHNGRLDEGVELITKPFTFAALAAKVRKMLDD